MTLTVCPHCGSELAGRTNPHCEGKTCGWIKCRKCGVNIDRRGRHGCPDPKNCPKEGR